MDGSGPIVSLDPNLIGLSDYPDGQCLEKGEHVLRLPTIHVHGQQDQGLDLHRRLRDEYCESTRL